MPAPLPRCPRCGYDLSGTVASWGDSCSVEGVCSECGLGFAWRELLDPGHRRTPMLFEHAGVRLGRSFRYTLWRSLRPWSFWRWVRIEHDVVPDRLAWFAVLGPVVAYLLGSLVLAVVAAAAHLLLGALTGHIAVWFRMNVPDLLLKCFAAAPYYFVEGVRTWAIVYASAVLGLLIAPSVLFVLGESLRMAGVRRAHLLRIWCYSLTVVAVMHAAATASLVGSQFVRRGAMGRGWLMSHPPTPGPLSGAVMRSAHWTMDHAPWLGAAAACLWMFLGLRAAAGSYLRLPHAGGIAAAAVIIGMAVGAVVGVSAWIVLWVP